MHDLLTRISLTSPPRGSELRHVLVELWRSDVEKGESLRQLRILSETNDQLRLKNEELATLLEAQDDKSLSLTLRLLQRTDHILQSVHSAQTQGISSGRQ